MEIVKLKKQVRRKLTGDENRSVRDEARLRLRTPKIIRMIDRVSFCNGVFGIVLTQYMMLRHPEWFWAYYAAVMVSLLAVRYFLYTKEKMQYFLIDFCYFAQCLNLLEIAIPHPTLSTINFLFANGPLAFAIIAWRNSLVFHSLDKVTSVYIHVLPLCLSYCNRWVVGGGESGTASFEVFFSAVGVYLLWQVVYLFVTEVKDRKKFENDKNLSSSLRWLAQKGHNIPCVSVVKKFLIKMKLLTTNEPLHAESVKTKFIMVISQLVFTVACMAWAVLLHGSEMCHILSSLLILACCVWNGAQYYFEVFAGNYQHRVVRSEPSSRESTPREEEGGLSSSE